MVITGKTRNTNKGEINLNNCNQPFRPGPMPRMTRDAHTPGCATCHENTDTSCACPKAAFPMNTAYAMAYVPFQQSGEVYTHERGLARGTMFPCLDLPFLKGCCK